MIIEVAQPGAEAVTFGLLSTAANLGKPLANGLGNWLFSGWQPSLSQAENYVDDASSFRDAVSCASRVRVVVARAANTWPSLAAVPHRFMFCFRSPSHVASRTCAKAWLCCCCHCSRTRRRTLINDLPPSRATRCMPSQRSACSFSRCRTRSLSTCWLSCLRRAVSRSRGAQDALHPVDKSCLSPKKIDGMIANRPRLLPSSWRIDSPLTNLTRALTLTTSYSYSC